jgi:hypothetical protein
MILLRQELEHWEKMKPVHFIFGFFIFESTGARALPQGACQESNLPVVFSNTTSYIVSPIGPGK